MAKKPRKRDEQFFESLAGVAGRFNVPSYDELLRPRALRVRDWHRQLAPVVLAYAKAAVGDAGSYSWALAGRAFGQPARRIYRLAAISTAAVTTIGALILANATYAVYANDISTPQALLSKKNTGTTILDRNGQALYRVYGANNRKLVEIKDVPKSMVGATLAAEDPDFYNHPGFSWRATARAIYQDLTSGRKAQGGSTITQQLVKNALLSPDKSYTRKYQEILLSMEIERRYSKDQIMQMYLNEVYYGQGSYGVESAAQTYFHKPAKDLSLGQSALLAGLPLGPSRFDPTIDPTTAQARRDFVLDRMQQLNLVSGSDAAEAKAEPVQAFAGQVEIHAPHFVFYVLDELRQKYGDDLVEKGGITVFTTLDLKKQDAAEAIVKNQIQHLAGHHAGNGGLVSLDPSNGDIIAMVGSSDWNNPEFGKVNVTLSQLQPGSSFKPFAYATAFKKGWTGANPIEDKPISLPAGDGTQYVPQNYDGKFHGTLTLRQALDNSLNIPAVKVLQFAGIHDTIQTAHDLGITSLNDENRYGLSLVLGGGEVRPLDMATAYGTLANAGLKVQPRTIAKVLDRGGRDITKPDAKPTQTVIDPRIAFMITHILSDNASRQPEFPANSPLKLSRPAAAKTGTTNDFRDNWTVGYTPDLVAAVWVGNNDHSAMLNVDGITGAAPIWHDFMEAASTGTPAHGFVAPAGVVLAKVCSKDGGLVNPWDGAGHEEVFLTEHPPTRKCSTQAPPPPEQPKDQPADLSKPADANPPDKTPPDVTPGPAPVPNPSPNPRPKPGPQPQN